MTTHTIEVSEEVYWKLEQMRVEKRLDTVEELLGSIVGGGVGGGSMATSVAGAGEPQTFGTMDHNSREQVVKVINEMLAGFEFPEAARNVARSYNVTQYAIRNLCTKSLGYSTAQFKNIVADTQEREKLIKQLRG